MNGTVPLDELGGAEWSGGGTGGRTLLDVGGCPPPAEGVSKHRACFEAVSRQASPRISFQ